MSRACSLGGILSGGLFLGFRLVTKCSRTCPGVKVVFCLSVSVCLSWVGFNLLRWNSFQYVPAAIDEH